MSLKESYKTIRAEAEAVIIEKRSRFIATAAPTATEAEALEFLERMRKKYSDATHNVYAYVIDENNIFRYSDDNEPSGTAGMPVLDTIRKSGLVDCAVVVTRYFGGTLLGTGGLVHAYGAAAKEGLNAAGIITRTLCDVLSVNVDYTTAGRLNHFFAEEKTLLGDTDYAAEVTFTLFSPVPETDLLTAKLTEITNGRAITKKIARQFIDA